LQLHVKSFDWAHIAAKRRTQIQANGLISPFAIVFTPKGNRVGICQWG